MKVSTLATEWSVHYRVVRVEPGKLLRLFNIVGKRLHWIRPGCCCESGWKILSSVSGLKH